MQGLWIGLLDSALESVAAVYQIAQKEAADIQEP